MDVSGEHQLDIAHSVLKHRLSLNGSPIEEEPEQYQLGGEREEGEEEGEEKGGDKCGRWEVVSSLNVVTGFSLPL